MPSESDRDHAELRRDDVGITPRSHQDRTPGDLAQVDLRIPSRRFRLVAINGFAAEHLLDHGARPATTPLYRS